MTTLPNEALLARQQLEQLFQHYWRVNLSSVVIALVLVLALWPMVAAQTLLIWLSLYGLVTLARHWHIGRCLRRSCDADTYLRQRNGLALGSALAGFSWAGLLLLGVASTSDSVFVLLILVLAGVSSAGGISLAGVPLAAMAFLFSILLPLALWLFSWGDYFHSTMGLMVLLYLGVTLLISRQAHQQMRDLLAATEENKSLLVAQQATEERMRSYFQRAPGFFYTMRFDGSGAFSMPFVSDGVRDVYGLSPEAAQLDFAVMEALVHPDDRALIHRQAKESARTLSAFHVVHRIQHPVKGERWVELNSVPQHEADGATRWDGFTLDVTERKTLEVALSAREREFRTLAENLPTAVMRYDAHCRRCYLNPAAERMLGGGLDELIGHVPGGPTVPATPAMIEHYRSQMEAVLADGELRELILVFDALPVAQREYYEVRFTRESDAHGKRSVLAIWHDISAHKHAQQRLELLNRAMNLSADAIYMIDEQLRFNFINEAACHALGYSRDELLAMELPQIDREVPREAMLSSMCEASLGIVNNFEAHHWAKDGRVYPVEISFVTFKDRGATLGLAVARDITERKAIEKSLMNSEQSLQEAQRIAHVGSWDVDMVNDKLIWSDEIFRIWEIDITKFKADFAAFLETVHPLDRERVSRIYSESVVNHTRYEVEHRLLFADGRIKHILEQGEPQYDAQGKPVRFIGTSLDITERKRMQEELAEREREFRSLAANLPDNIARWDVEGRYLYINPTHERTLGMTAAEVVGKPLFAVHDQVRVAIAQVVASGQVFELMRQPVPVNGEIQIHDVSLVPERDAEGHIVSVLGIGRDMTDAYCLQEAIAAREQEFRSLAESSPDNIVRFDREGRYRYVNENLMRTFAHADVIGKRPSELWSDGRYAALEAAAAQALENGEKQVVEVRHQVDACIEYHQIVVLPERDVQGEIIGTLVFGRDVTAIRDTEHRLRGLVENLPGIAYTFRRTPQGEGSFPYVSPGVEAIYGVTAQAAMGDFTVMHGLVHPDDKAAMEADIAESARRLTPLRVEVRICPQGLRERWIEVRSNPQAQPDGGILWYGFIFDVTERKLMESALSQREQEARTLVEHSPDTISRYDLNCRRVYVNPAFAALVDGGEATLLGKTPNECPGWINANLYEAQLRGVLASGESSECELNWFDRWGKERWSHVRMTPERDAAGAIVSALTVGRDITELNASRQKILRMVFHDPLTELPNRALFSDRLSKVLSEAAWRGQAVGVMLLDLDRFKDINDTLGHPAGDALLCEVSVRLASCVRVYDSVARFGGDEFAILLPDVRSSSDFGGIAGKIFDAFRQPFLLGGKEVFVTASLGIAVYPDDGEVVDDLVRNADAAMYLAKRSGRNGFRFYSKELTIRANDRLALESDLRHALTRNELVLYFQPKVNLGDGSLQGSEALLRWMHPARGLVPPDQFIGLAEDSGQIVEIGEWVLRSACQAARAWNGEGLRLHKVAINLSARQFQRGHLIFTVQQALKDTGCLAEWIELEITESLLIDEDGCVLDTLNSFREMGITIAIDDFGTGYSALSYLARFPIDTLKIDRSFIAHVSEQGHHAELVKAILSIAHCLGQKVVAEGVENVEQALLLQGLGCHLAQGYLYSKPVPRAAFEQLDISQR